METISNSLFWISNGLLVPVIVLLLLFFLRAIILAGGFFGEFYQRMKLQKQLSEMLETITPENINEQRFVQTVSSAVLAVLPLPGI